VTGDAIAGAQEIATQFWQGRSRTAEAREKEAAAALQKCAQERGCGAEERGDADYEIGEIDPLGKWGHSHLMVTGEQCYQPGQGCSADFSFTRNLTEQNGRKSTMVLRVVIDFDGERARLYSYESRDEYTQAHQATYDIPANAVLLLLS
jgi:hypothetical protein